MESTSSSASPFQRTAQPHTIDTSTGNVLRRRVFRTKCKGRSFTQENAKLMEQVKLFKGKESVQDSHHFTVTEQFSIRKMDEKVCIPRMQKIQFGDNKDTD
ncbi:hypothetical protein H5410_002758 [Solanum commersonii]|uniref:Uncharacterized protein n=1 Tax=Solanum commersonii TaxID=4109 RepID=A0A9J6B2W2_SOLCO|nr:hypothetical protein H5410_002758 [Solanum commersonii]